MKSCFFQWGSVPPSKGAVSSRPLIQGVTDPTLQLRKPTNGLRSSWLLGWSQARQGASSAPCQSEPWWGIQPGLLLATGLGLMHCPSRRAGLNPCFPAKCLGGGRRASSYGCMASHEASSEARASYRGLPLCPPGPSMAGAAVPPAQPFAASVRAPLSGSQGNSGNGGGFSEGHASSVGGAGGSGPRYLGDPGNSAGPAMWDTTKAKGSAFPAQIMPGAWAAPATCQGGFVGASGQCPVCLRC